MKTTVIVRLEVDGFHNYPTPPSEVHFLSYLHRHSFVITFAYKVSSLDREKEIFICRDEVKSYLYKTYGSPCRFKNMSCEMIAKDILNKYFSDGMIWCEVWEENTGGAKVEI